MFDVDGIEGGLLLVLIFAVPLIWGAYWSWACEFLAREKERHEWRWAVAGFTLGPFAFLPLAFAPDLTDYGGEDDQENCDAADRLTALAGLHDAGHITTSEFDAKRAQILEDL